MALAAAALGMLTLLVRPAASPEARSPVAPTTTPASEAPDRPRAVFLGDSWVEGAGSTYVGGGFAAQVAEAAGWQFINAGQGGTGYVTDGPPDYPDRSPLPSRVQDVIAQAPDVVIVAAGINDAGRGYGEELLSSAVAETLQSLQEGLPNAFMAVIGPFWPNEAPTQSVLDVDNVVREQCQEFDIPFVSPIAERWITGTNDGTVLGNRTRFISQDGANLTQEGHDYVAQKVLAFLQTQPGLPYAG
ncbi:SGNH/GDSL hydrolase family protein [Geodermatophilus sp. SYSU D00804]